MVSGFLNLSPHLVLHSHLNCLSLSLALAFHCLRQVSAGQLALHSALHPGGRRRAWWCVFRPVLADKCKSKALQTPFMSKGIEHTSPHEQLP